MAKSKLKLAQEMNERFGCNAEPYSIDMYYDEDILSGRSMVNSAGEVVYTFLFSHKYAIPRLRFYKSGEDEGLTKYFFTVGQDKETKLFVSLIEYHRTVHRDDDDEDEYIVPTHPIFYTSLLAACQCANSRSAAGVVPDGKYIRAQLVKKIVLGQTVEVERGDDDS